MTTQAKVKELTVVQVPNRQVGRLLPDDVRDFVMEAEREVMVCAQGRAWLEEHQMNDVQRELRMEQITARADRAVGLLLRALAHGTEVEEVVERVVERWRSIG